MKIILGLLLFAVPIVDASESKRQKDIDAINAMCGCYEVTFEYAETFATDKAYEFRDNYQASGLEWIFAEKVSDDRYALQHLLIVSDSTIIKHWRQDWVYESTDQLAYIKGKYWNYQPLQPDAVQGQWMQKVYQVDDSPRYEGSATWVHVDGKSYWENAVDAPLPRREHTKRDDYNVMRRLNRHEITGYGWVHEQDNQKILRMDDRDSVLVMEKGFNKYKKVADEECGPAIRWWAMNKDYWLQVREVWDEVYAERKDLIFKKEVIGSSLSRKLFDFQDEVMTSESSSRDESKAAIRKLIELHRTDTLPVDEAKAREGTN